MAHRMHYLPAMNLLLAAIGATYLVAVDLKQAVWPKQTTGKQGFEWSREESK